MKLKIHASEIRRAVKILSGVMGAKQTALGNIQIQTTGDCVELSATNGSMFEWISIPMIGLEDDLFCVDGAMLNSVLGAASGEVEISSDGRVCAIKAVGRTRLPIVTDKELPECTAVKGESITVDSTAFADAFSRVEYAIANDETRPVLTGALLESDGNTLKMIALDGFSMSIEAIPANGAEIRMIVPGAALKKVRESVFDGEQIRIATDGTRVQFQTDGMEIVCTLLQGEFVDYQRLLPADWKYSARIPVGTVKEMISGSMIVGGKDKNLVKLAFSGDEMRLASNSEQADYEATAPVEMQGGEIKIAFNGSFLRSTLGAIDTEYATMNMNGPSSPAVFIPEGKENSVRLILPVRLMG